MRFRAILTQEGKTATGIVVPDDVVTGLGASRRPAVHVALNGYAYRSTIASRGGRFMLPVSAAVRRSASVSAGAEVDVEVTLDDAPREVTVPADLAVALDAAPTARAAFDALSYSKQLRHVLAVEGAKQPATRQRRLAAVVTELGGP